MDPKMVPEFGFLSPKWGPENGAQKLVLDLNYDLISSLGPPLWVPFCGLHFGGQILAPFWGPFLVPHLGLQNWCESSKVLLPKFVCKANIGNMQQKVNLQSWPG